MRIAHVTDYFQPQAGYQEYFFARAHREMGHEVLVVTSDRYFPFPAYAHTWDSVLGPRQRTEGLFEESGVAVRRLPVWFEIAASATLALRGLEGALRDFAPDVVMGHDLLSPTTYLLTRARRNLGFRLVLDNHACAFNTRLDDTLLKRIYVWLFRHLTAPAVRSGASALYAVGHGEQHLACAVLDLPPERIPIVPLGADEERFRPSAEARRVTRERLGIPEDEVLFVHAGKLTREKDVHVLLAAFGQALASTPACRLLLIGGGEPSYLGELRAQALALPPGRVIEHPSVPNEQLPALLAAADVGVWPGNLSQVVVEALGCGLPLVLAELVSPGYPTAHLIELDNGRAFPRGDVPALAACLRELAADAGLRARMGEASRRLLLERLTWTRVAGRVLEGV
jgi:glycosyltransferase involved in cell wall biosynthesis